MRSHSVGIVPARPACDSLDVVSSALNTFTTFTEPLSATSELIQAARFAWQANRLDQAQCHWLRYFKQLW